jgi:TP901 family phage tail tape measure protein
MSNSIKMTLELDGKDALKTLQGLQKGLEDTSKTTEKAAKAGSNFTSVWVGNLAAIATVKFGAFIKAQIGQSIDSFKEFELRLVGTAKTAGLTAAEMAVLAKNLNKLSREIPATVQELGDITRAAGQLGVTGTKNLTLFASTISKLGRASDLSGDEAATSLTRILTVTREGVSRIDEFASGIVALGNNFAATESEIVNVTNEVARASAQFGVSAGEAAALSAAMRSFGIRAEEAGTVVSKTFLAIQAAIEGGGAQLKQLEKITGESGAQLRKQFGEDALGVFQKFLEGSDRLQKSGAVLNDEYAKIGLTGIRISKTLPVLSQNFDQVARALDIYNKGSVNAIALNEEFARGLDTLDSDIQLWKNAVDEAGRGIVGAFGPIASKSLRAFTSNMENVTALFSGDEVRQAEVRLKGLGDELAQLKSDTDLLNSVAPKWATSLTEVGADLRISEINREIQITKQLLADLAPIDPSKGIRELEAELKKIDKESSDPILSAIYGTIDQHTDRRKVVEAQLENLRNIKALHDNTLANDGAKAFEDETKALREQFDVLREIRIEQQDFDKQKIEVDREDKLARDQLDLEELQTILGEQEAIREIAKIQEIQGEEKQAEALNKLRDNAIKKRQKDDEAAEKAQLAFQQQIGNQRIALAQNTAALLGAALGSENKIAFAVQKAAAAAQLAIGTSQALAMVPAQTAAIPFPANLAAAAQMTSLIKINAGIQAATIAASSIKGFQDGGIVGGTSQVNDRQLIRANAGERILTARENRILTEALDEKALGGQGGNTFNFNNTTLLNEGMIDEIIDGINDAQEFRNKQLRVG